jgi:N-dimethylarginine dimethylaminohydrolase
MEKSEENLIAKHINHDDELRKYVEEHRQYEETIEKFNQRVYLTSHEEVEKKKLQKMKLLGKEKIYTLLSKYREE